VADRFQILALDGGGYKGMFSAAVLAKLEEDLGTSVVEHFDLVAGTSTGGIIALGLGAGLTPLEMVQFYVDHGARIFGQRRLRAPRQLFRSKYSAAPLAAALEEVFGERLFGSSRVPLVIPSYDLRGDKTYLFRTDHAAHLTRDWRERMVDVALATAAAPTYLPAHALRGMRYVDGIWANNPSLVALVEAVRFLGAELEDIQIFSLGTTSEVKARPTSLDHGGFLPWTSQAADIIMRGQAMGASNAAMNLVGENHWLRCNPPTPEGLLKLDGLSTDELLGRAEDESRRISPNFKTMFTEHKGAAHVSPNI